MNSRWHFLKRCSVGGLYTPAQKQVWEEAHWAFQEIGQEEAGEMMDIFLNWFYLFISNLSQM